MMGKLLKENKTVNDAVDGTYINLTTSSTLDDIGSGGFGKIWVYAKILFSVFKHVLCNKTDLCYVTLNSKGPGFYKDFLVVLILKLFRKNILFHFHNKGIRNYSHKFLDKMLYRFCFRNTKSILLTSSLYHDISEFVEEEDIFYCPNGIPEIVSEQSFEKVSDTGEFRFLFLSNMMREKGVLDLLSACKILKEKGFNFQCDFVGAWSDITEEKFIDTVNEYKLDDCVFSYGKKYNEEKLVFFNQADAFVFPTHDDTFALVVLEAMQAKLPVVSTFEGGIPDVVEDGKSAFLVAKKNEIELADRMETLLKNPSLAREMGSYGRERYDRFFTISNFERNMTAVLTRAVSSF